MNKFIATLLIYCLTITSVVAGLPPTTLSGDQSATKPTTFSTTVPNNQATQVAGIKSRIETGNTNLLSNPSFEASTFSSGWTASLGTASLESTKIVDGKQAYSITSAGAGVRAYQVSTINAANLKGLQGVARVSVYSTDSALQVCALVDGTATGNETNCVTPNVTTTNNPFVEVVIPFILGGTSNGIVVKSATTSAQTIVLDNSFVGQGLPLQNVSGAKLVDAITVSGCSAAWSTTSTSFTDFSAQTGCTYTSAKGVCSSPATNIPGVKCTLLPAGDYRLEYDGWLGSDTSNRIADFQFWDGINTAREISSFYGTASTIETSGISQSISYSSNQSNITLSIRGRSPTATGTAYIGGNNSTRQGVIKVWYFPPDSKIYSTASQDISWQACTFSTLAWQGLGTVTNNLLCARERGNLKIKGKFTTGTTSASLGQIPLPTNFGTISIASNIQSNSIAGTVFVENASTGVLESLLISPSATVIQHSNALINTAINPSIAVNGSAAFANSVVVSFNGEISIPIQGWQDYGVIVGSFAGIEKCANDYECTDTFSAQIDSSGNVSGENIDWINGNCSLSTSTFTCTYLTTLKDGTSVLSSAMNCRATAMSDGRIFTFTANSTTGFSLKGVSDAGAATAYAVSVSCQKGTNDYKPKTAKVASSIGVPTVPNAGTALIDTFSVSYGTTNATTVCSASPCSYLDQIGNVVSSITRSATGNYTLNLSKTYTKLKCTGLTNGAMNALRCESCNALSFVSANAAQSAAADSYGTLYCQGSY